MVRDVGYSCEPPSITCHPALVCLPTSYPTLAKAAKVIGKFETDFGSFPYLARQGNKASKCRRGGRMMGIEELANAECDLKIYKEAFYM